MSRLRKRSPHGSATFVLCFILLFLFSTHSDVCFSEMKRGLSVCAEILVPTLFPYTVICEMLVRADLGYYIGKLLERPMRRFFGISGCGASALTLGIICGFPIGAKVAASLYERGDISRPECERLLSFCNYPSAPFVIFTVGKKLLGNTLLGLFIYAANVGTGLILASLSHGKNQNKYFLSPPLKAVSDKSVFKIFTESIASGAGAVISVCAMVTFFTCAVGCLSAFKFIQSAPIIKAVVFSFFELTSGVAACAAISSRYLAAILTASAVGWSGLSVLMQISSCYSGGTAPSLIPYIKSRLISSIVCAASTAAVLLSPVCLPGKASDTDVFLDLTVFPPNIIYIVNILFILSLPLCFNKKLDRRQTI